MFDFGFGAYSAALLAEQKLHKARKALWAAMPPEEAKAAEAEWRRQTEIERQRKHEIAVAEAGRARNWLGK